MTVQVLDVNANPPQVVSQSTITGAELGDGKTLVVLSGVALIDWKYDSDVVWHGQTEVNLGFFASNIDQASAFIGLASVMNDDSSFLFAADTVSVGLRDSGELYLHIDTALMGEFSYLVRISYQVVATLAIVSPHIAGTITWPASMFTPQAPDPGLVSGAFGIVANHIEHINPPSGGFGFTKLTPLTPGQIFKVEKQGSNFVAHYRIDNPKLALPLQVTVDAGPPFPGNALCGQINGPREFTLTGSMPSMDGVDFIVSVLRVN